MKKVFFLFITICTIVDSFAQSSLKTTVRSFEKDILNYQPVQRKNVSKKSYEYGVMILNETKKAVKNNPKNFNLADYFNVLSAFLTLKESSKNIELAFEKFINTERSCEYILAFEDQIRDSDKYDIIREQYLEELQLCKSRTEVKDALNLKDYCKSNNLDYELVKLMSEINDQDKLYRNSNWKENAQKQIVIDQQNQILIDSLFTLHNQYIGKEQVGETFEHVMWSVIQHSNILMMEKYLPVIHNAYLQGNLDVGPLKMLIDRMYGLKYGYQIFGSQSGFDFEMADEKTRTKIMETYQIK